MNFGDFFRFFDYFCIYGPKMDEKGPKRPQTYIVSRFNQIIYFMNFSDFLGCETNFVGPTLSPSPGPKNWYNSKYIWPKNKKNWYNSNTSGDLPKRKS